MTPKLKAKIERDAEGYARIHSVDDFRHPLHTAYTIGAESLLPIIEEMREMLELSAKSMTINAGELGGAVKEIDEDPFENWDEGRESLKGIYTRMRIAAKNAETAYERFVEEIK